MVIPRITVRVLTRPLKANLNKITQKHEIKREKCTEKLKQKYVLEQTNVKRKLTFERNKTLKEHNIATPSLQLQSYTEGLQKSQNTNLKFSKLWNWIYSFNVKYVDRLTVYFWWIL